MSCVRTADRTFSLLDGETLLDALERTGHEVDAQCRSGFCGACRLPLLSGEVTYLSEPIAYVGEAEVLPCCCTVRNAAEVACHVRQTQRSDSTAQEPVAC